MSLSCVPMTFCHRGTKNGLVALWGCVRTTVWMARGPLRPFPRRFGSRALGLVLGVCLAAASGPGKAGAIGSPALQNPVANLSGTVQDETGAAISEAEVSAINANTGLLRTSVTDDRGYFTIAMVPAGTYSVSARMPGFGTVLIKGVQVHAGIDVSLAIRLKPKGITETIDVVAGGDATSGNGARVSGLDTSNPATKYSVTNREVMSLPVFANELGRNTLESLPFLVPGVAPNTTLGTLSELKVSGIAVNGSRSSSVNFNIEGGDDNDDEYNVALASLPNPDALEEFTFITSNYQADLGRSAGGVINAVVKSGTTHLRGNVRYLGINDALNARGFFDPSTPRFRLNNFGGQLGGPAALPIRGLRDRLSFFADYEGTRSQRQSTSNFLVPSPEERRGDFRALPLIQQPFDPLTGNVVTRPVPFPGGVIPPDRLNAISQTYLKLFVPLPNSGSHNLIELLPTKFANDQSTVRLDLKQSDRDNVNLIFLSGSSRVEEPTGYLPAGARYGQDASSDTVILRDTRVLGASSVNEVTAAITRYNSSVGVSAPGGSGHDPKEFGFTGIHPQTSARLAAPTVFFSTAVSPILLGYGYSSTKSAFQVKDDFSKSSGRHFVKFGADFRRYDEERLYAPGSIDGEFQFSYFNPQGTRNELADFLLGLPFAYFQATDSSAYPRRISYQFYGMDDIRLSPGLTLNLGLRYELTPPAVDRHNQVSAFRPGQQSSVFPNAPQGLIFVGDVDPVLGKLSRGLYRTDYRDVAPRVGLAFAPRRVTGPLGHIFGEGKTAIRAGWGLFYDHTALSSSTRISIQTQPFAYSQSLYLPDSFEAPFGAGDNPWPIDLNKRNFSLYPFLYCVDPSFRTPYTYHYDFTVQREITATTAFELSFVGSSSFRTVRDRQINPALVGPGANLSNLQSRRIYPALGRIVSAESSGRGYFDSLQAQLRRQFSHGLMFQASYVLSKSRDNGGPAGPGPNLFQWARSPFNRTHNAVVSFSYDLPGLALRHSGRLLFGWRMSGILEFRSGLPLDIYQTSDPTLSQGDHGVPDLVGDFRRVDPRKAQTPPSGGLSQRGNFFFDPSAFRVVPVTLARNGNLPRMSFDGPGFDMWSVSIAKTYRIAASQQIVLRADIRNLFNHANFDSPNVVADSALFGQVTSAAPGRTVQYSVRFVF